MHLGFKLYLMNAKPLAVNVLLLNFKPCKLLEKLIGYIDVKK